MPHIKGLSIPQKGEKKSDKYEGFLICANGSLKLPYIRKNGKAANHYFLEIQCDACNKSFLEYKSNVLRKNRNKFGCSPECHSKIKTTPDGTRTKKHPGKEDSYILVKNSKHPNATTTGWVLEHRLIMEEKIGRYLKKEELVHHINMIKSDNRIENLYICSGASEHKSAHASLNSCVDALLKTGVIIFKNGKYELKQRPR